MTENIEVVRNDETNRYEINVDGKLAGFTAFINHSDGSAIFPHTEVFPEFGGMGLASTLVDFAMRDVAARGQTVVPLCPYVAKFVTTHEIPGLKIAQRP